MKSAVAVAVIPQYLRAAAWPSRLSLFHPYPASVSTVAFFAGVGALLLGSAIALVSAGRVPALAAGWTWFLVALLPALGLVQGGLWPAWADRYAYFGLFGLCLGVSFALAEIAGRDLGRRAVAGVVLVAALVGFALVTRKQVGHWKNSLALFDRAVAVEPRAGMMRFCFGSALLAAGAPGPALEHLEVATTLHPLRFDMQAMLAAALDRLGRADAAEERYRIALRVHPDYPVALYNLADLLRRRGRMGEARGLYQRFLRAESGSRSRARSDAFEKQRLLAEAYVAMSPGAPATRSRRPAPASDARP